SPGRTALPVDEGTRVAGVGTRVGVKAPKTGRVRPVTRWARRAAELASEATDGGRRRAGVPVKHDRGRRPSRLTSRQRCPNCATGPRASLVASTPGRGALPRTP